MQILKVNQKIAEALFNIGFMIQTLVMVVGYSAWDIPYRGHVLHISFCLFCIKILMTQYCVREWVIMLILGTFGVTSYLFTGEEYVLMVVVMIFAAKSVDFEKLLKVVFFCVLISLIVIPLLSLMGLGHEPYDIRDYGRGGLEKRWGFGFGHANNFHGTIWYVVTFGILLYRKNMRWVHFFALTVLNIIIFQFTVSKAGFLCSQIVIISAWILPYILKMKNLRWIYCFELVGLFGIQALSIVSATVDIENSFVLKTLDRIFTGRIRLAKYHAATENWHLFQSMGDVSIVDNGWVTVYANYGYLIGILFLLLHLWVLYQFYKKKMLMESIILMTSIFYIFMESSYCMNNAYILSNMSYILAMFLVKKDLINESING